MTDRARRIAAAVAAAILPAILAAACASAGAPPGGPEDHVAPTILNILAISRPPQMTADSLLVPEPVAIS